MNIRRQKIMLATALLLQSVCCAEACTSLRVKTADGLIFYARTMEGGASFNSTISVIPKGSEYRGRLPGGLQDGLKWTAKYDMMGMNVNGFPLLVDGLNENGLACGGLLFRGFAEYQPFDPKMTSNTISNWEVVTWILSNFASVDEVKHAINDIRVCDEADNEADPLPLHYVVHDSSGACIVIEYVKGALKVYDNPIGVMTNSPPFDWHLINLRNYVNIYAANVLPFEISGVRETGLGQGTGMLGLPGDYTPPSRLIRMAALVSSALPVTGADAGLNLAMTIINNVDIAKGSIRDLSRKAPSYDFSEWVTVSDLGRKRLYFRTYDNKSWRYVDLGKAIQSAKGIMTIQIKNPPEYEDVTATARRY